MTDLQRIASDLRPMILDELGLPSAIQWLAQNLSERSSLSIELSFERADVVYSKDVSTAAFRIVQEALINIIRNSGAASARIVARHSGNELQLDISDDGRGMEVARSRRVHLGLVGMSERAHMLGGSMKIDSTSGRGTRISVQLPLSIDKVAAVTAAMIRLFVADDHTIFREGLKQMLAEETDFRIVGEATTGDEVLTQLPSLSCEIVLLDLTMPGRSGISLLRCGTGANGEYTIDTVKPGAVPDPDGKPQALSRKCRRSSADAGAGRLPCDVDR